MCLPLLCKQHLGISLLKQVNRKNCLKSLILLASRIMLKLMKNLFEKIRKLYERCDISNKEINILCF
jgi:hypothetical protein